MVKDISGKQLFEDSGHSIDEIQHNLDKFKLDIQAIMTAPPPKEEKPAEGEKKEGEAEEKADAEMKDESKP